MQRDKLFEVILIDGTRTGLSSPQIPGVSLRILPAARPALAVMRNQAILEAEGHYLHFLNPGEFYISARVFSFVERVAKLHDFPDLLYGGGFIRHSLDPPTVFFRQIQMRQLQEAGLPHSLQLYWFRKETIQMMGRFCEKFEIEGGFDLICRLYASNALRKVFMRRILTDYEYRRPSKQWVVRRFQEGLTISFLHFGFNRFLFLWVGKNCLRLVRWWWKMIKSSFWRKDVAV